ncbi:alpha/beta hydrolase fold family protein [Schizopora paradoxa]|uniref:Alpha/beta hydrolase fold family protein n=1 Tax=Schizopora paradoxa TaxID=27342 RepID=A0A0H2RJ70_9AGAM|nr:alpha/beta hydrolase fold family protein [Schizopora paradoxa]
MIRASTFSLPLRRGSSALKAIKSTTHRSASTSFASKRELNQSFKLPDGRTLGFAEYGIQDGYPLFYFHGFPSSRLEPAPIDDIFRKHNLRAITPDRPGFGISSPQPGRRITDWPADVRALAENLRLPHYAVLGGSGGGPYALACAHLLPREQLSAVGVLAGAPPWEAGPGVPLPIATKMSRPRRMLAASADRTPGVLRVVSDASVGLIKWMATTRAVTKRIDAWLEAQVKSAKTTNPDGKQPRTTEERRELILRPLFEGFAQGSGAMVEETQLLAHDWGFRFEDVTFDKISIWHGLKDANAPIEMIRYMAERLPHAHLHEFDDTHYTIGRRLDEVLSELLSDAKAH